MSDVLGYRGHSPPAVQIYSTARDFLDSCQPNEPPSGKEAAPPTSRGRGGGGGSGRRRTLSGSARPPPESAYGTPTGPPPPRSAPRGSGRRPRPSGHTADGALPPGGVPGPAASAAVADVPRRSAPPVATPRSTRGAPAASPKPSRFGALVAPSPAQRPTPRAMSDAAATPRQRDENARPRARRPASGGPSKGGRRPSCAKKAAREPPSSPTPKRRFDPETPPNKPPSSSSRQRRAVFSTPVAPSVSTPRPAPATATPSAARTPCAPPPSTTPPPATAAPAAASRPPPPADDSLASPSAPAPEVVVQDEARARGNDAILARRIAEAKGSRGKAPAYAFPLWTKKKAPAPAAPAPAARGAATPVAPAATDEARARANDLAIARSISAAKQSAATPYQFPLWRRPAAAAAPAGAGESGALVRTGALGDADDDAIDDATAYREEEAREVADDCSVNSSQLSECGSVSTVATALPVVPISVDLTASRTVERDRSPGRRRREVLEDERSYETFASPTGLASPMDGASPEVLRAPARTESPRAARPARETSPEEALAPRRLGNSLPARNCPVHPTVALPTAPEHPAAWAADGARPRQPVQTPQPMHWRRGEQLGEGTFGKVYLALNERNGELFACKQISLCADAGAAELTELESEIRLLKTIDHKHVVRYLGTEMRRSEGVMYLFLEYVPGGSIASMLAQFGVFSEVLIRIYVTQILRGVKYLHERKIVHRDIKGANILVNDSGVAKLADFGCSKQLQGMRTGTLEQSLQAIQGSVPWMAPEVIKQSGHGRGADIWSVGATVIEMATAHHPWPKFSNNLAALFQIATSKSPPPAPETLSDAARAFLDRCLIVDPKDRATARDLLSDPFLFEDTNQT